VVSVDVGVELVSINRPSSKEKDLKFGLEICLEKMVEPSDNVRCEVDWDNLGSTWWS
jgi:hypothetical protein